MSNKIDILERMLAGGIRIRNDEMGEAWEVVFRAQRLSPALNNSTTIEEIRERLSGRKLLKAKLIRVQPSSFRSIQTLENAFKLVKIYFINHACTFLDLGGITIEVICRLGRKLT